MQTTERGSFHTGSTAAPMGRTTQRDVRREDTRTTRHDDIQTTRKVMAGTYSVEALAGAAVVTLTILALVDVLPVYLTAIAVIVAGGAFLVEGAGLGARAKQIRRSLQAKGVNTGGLIGGVSVQLLAGVAGVALGVLALIGMSPNLLLAISAIVFGSALLLGPSATREVSRLEQEHPYEASVAHESLRASNGARAMVGAGAIALGILALIGVGPVVTLIVIAILAVGAILFLSGIAIGAGEASAAREAY